MNSIFSWPKLLRSNNIQGIFCDRHNVKFLNFMTILVNFSQSVGSHTPLFPMSGVITSKTMANHNSLSLDNNKRHENN